MPCDDGPYVWDKSEHREGNLEGIGSTFQFRKSSLIASHILKAKWIGKLINSHEKEEGDQSRYFGLSYPSCDRNSGSSPKTNPASICLRYGRKYKYSKSYCQESTIKQHNGCCF